VCLRLWTQHDDRSLPERDVPEIRRVDLAGPLLELLAWGERDVAAFEWFEAPEPAAVERALALLRVLGAVDESGLTATGRRMASLPVHPRLARLVLAGHEAGVRERARCWRPSSPSATW
jgi:ATP-dependent helicase HrpB